MKGTLNKFLFLLCFFRHAPDLWNCPNYMYERFFPSLWESFQSPWYTKPRVGATSYTYIEFAETGKGRSKKDCKEGMAKAEQNSHEELVEDHDSFKVSFDVSKFKPEEITIRSEDGELIVEGKQEVKGEDGFSSRHFVRAYSLPRNVDHDSFTSRLSKEGILSIEAKKLQKAEAKDNFIKIETEK